MKFEKTQNSYYAHYQTFGLGNYRGNAFTTGCSHEGGFCYQKTEILDMTEMKWYNDKLMVTSDTFRPTDVPPGDVLPGDIPPDYPFTQDGIFHYSTTHTSDAVFIIGGYNTGNIVAEFRDYKWKHIADLKQARSRHSSIAFGSQTIIIGGEHSSGEDLSTEVWNFETGDSRSIQPTLPSYSPGIALYFVNFNFFETCFTKSGSWN